MKLILFIVSLFFNSLFAQIGDKFYVLTDSLQNMNPDRAFLEHKWIGKITKFKPISKIELDSLIAISNGVFIPSNIKIYDPIGLIPLFDNKKVISKSEDSISYKSVFGNSRVVSKNKVQELEIHGNYTFTKHSFKFLMESMSAMALGIFLTFPDRSPKIPLILAGCVGFGVILNFDLGREKIIVRISS